MMGMSAIEIYKLLPKTNCGDCGFPTCLAFAMQLANMKVELGQCPHVSQDAHAALGAASAPPIKLVTVGEGEGKLEIGDEKVLLRHEKTFYHAPPLVGIVEDGWDAEKIRSRAADVKSLVFDRVGQEEGMNAVAVWHTTGDMGEAAKIAKEASGMPIVLVGSDEGAMRGALGAIGGDKPLVVSSRPDKNAAMVALAKEHGCPIAVGSDGGLEGLADEVKAAKDAGVEDIVMLMKGDLGTLFNDLVAARRLAINKGFRELGYPTMTIIEAEDNIESVLEVSTLLMKYSSMLLLRNYSPELILPLVTLRLNIFTDPQKPIQVKPGIYKVGEPGPDSPFMLTSNFSLTYFSVEGDVDKSKIPSRILVIDTEGLSVLTAFAAGKMEPDKMADAVAETGIADELSHKKLIIPGMIARASGKLGELTGWEIIVGPRESTGIPKFLRNL
jgi:acetyl-CoA decarbonylase/synthase complex subunit gamma